MSFFSVGVSALNAAQLGLTTAGHNIANVNTDGFHRQAISQASNVALQSGAGFIGQGAHVDSIKRVYSQFLDSQVLQAQTQGARLDTYQTEITQIDNILADPNSGLSPALQDFFKAVGDVATNPQSIPSRQALISSASAMVTRFQTLDQRFTEVRNGVNSQITESLSKVNSLAQQLANINDQIVVQTGSTNQPPNDLLDTRDNLVSQLNQLVSTTVVTQSDGALNIFIGNGQPLVVGQQAFKLVAIPSPEDQRRIEVGYQSGATTILLPNNSLSGGSLGGLLDFRLTTLDPAQNALGRTAMALAKTFNDQHALGQDLNNNLGGNFFAQPLPVVLASSSNNAASGVLGAALSNAAQLTTSDYRIQVTGTGPYAYQITDLATNVTTAGLSNATLATAIPGLTLTPPATMSVGDVFTVQPTRFAARDIAISNTINTTTIAAADPISTFAVLTNTGTAKIGAGAVSSTANLPQIPAPAVAAVPATITYNLAANQFTGFPAFPVTVTDNAGVSTVYAAGAPVTYPAGGGTIAFGGLSFTLSGTPANGDQFTIASNTNGVSDNRNALLLAKLQTTNTMVGGTTSYQGAYSQLVSQIGNKAAEIQVTAKAEANLLTQAKSSQQSMSGVNLDEEAANLLRFQQAYQAAGKMMQVATVMFDTLLAIGK